MAFANIYRDKRVLVTGHTGFKGSWLSEWLLFLGAEVTGLALPPDTQPALFEQLGLQERLHHRIGDIRNLEVVEAAMAAAQPDIIFHLAAQPLVRLSYEQPIETYATNFMGTAHVLEAVRLRAKPCVIVAVTTDKCYENREDGRAYQEDDPMGGHDPYSSSKGATELLITAYRRSYFSAHDSPIKLASVRAGNVIGGGDWALDRIVPDCIRALQRDEAVGVRNKASTRPWQHVLEPLSGYLWLGARLAQCALHLDTAFNFGPTLDSNRAVAELVQEVLKHWPGRWADRSDPTAVHEAKLLNLSTDKAVRLLQWRPVWNFTDTIRYTVDWYRHVHGDAGGAAARTRAQIEQYMKDARARGIAWST